MKIHSRKDTIHKLAGDLDNGNPDAWFHLLVMAVTDDPDMPGVTGHPGELVGKVVLCGNGALELDQLQPEGKGPMAAQAFLNGARLVDGTRLGT